MRTDGRRRSSNVEDRRGGGAPRRRGRALGLGGLVVVLGVLAVGAATGTDVGPILNALLGGGGSGAPSSSSGGPPAQTSAAEAQTEDRVRVVLADTEDTWTQLFRERGQTYQAPTLVLFRDQVSSACGLQSAAVGPFYCPGDRKAYLDLSFFDELARRFQAPGDFAQAYVLAHEIGHHIQTITGEADRFRALERGRGEVERNAVSVRQELQADCYAGVWAHHAHHQRQLLDEGDLEEGLTAAAAIGDDTIQRRARGRAVPESFTHGTSEQRVRWFRAGFASGRIESCDTLAQGG